MRYCSKKILILLFVIATSTGSSFSQFYYYNNKYYDKDLLFEVGLSVGSMHGMTDVGRKKFSKFLPSNLDFSSTKLNGSIYYGFMYQGISGGRVEATIGRVAGSDQNGLYKGRNLSYRSRISELSVLGEFHPLMLKSFENIPSISPYIIAGFGAFSFWPQALYNNEWVPLHSLRTEGQGCTEYPNRKQYKLTQLTIPFGSGLKYELSPKYNLRLESVLRYTFTDYLDDASTTSVDPSLFSKYLGPDEAALAAALTDRRNEKAPGSAIGRVQRGGRGKDKYLTINLKFGLVLGRERIR
jgi:hypothetical protein